MILLKITFKYWCSTHMCSCEMFKSRMSALHAALEIDLRSVKCYIILKRPKNTKLLTRDSSCTLQNVLIFFRTITNLKCFIRVCEKQWKNVGKYFFQYMLNTLIEVGCLGKVRQSGIFSARLGLIFKGNPVSIRYTIFQL